MNKFDLLLNSDKKIAIWGLGFYGMNCLDFLINTAKLSISLIIDQNKHKTMNEYLDVPLVSPDIFINDPTNNNYIVIVTIRNGVNLLSHGALQTQKITENPKIGLLIIDEAHHFINPETISS